MDVDGYLRDPLSRRRFFARSGVGVAGATAVLLGGCADDSKTLTDPGPDESDEADVEILNSALDLELEAIAAYKAGAALLKGRALRAVKGFLEQEQAHADGLAAAIRDAGGTPNRPKRSYDFPRLRTRHDVLTYAVDLENIAIAAYMDALPKLGEGDLRATAASIMSNEAEHVSVLLGLLGSQQVPSAFVVGKAP
jgi:rubrerythrin